MLGPENPVVLALLGAAVCAQTELGRCSGQHIGTRKGKVHLRRVVMVSDERNS